MSTAQTDGMDVFDWLEHRYSDAVSINVELDADGNAISYCVDLPVKQQNTEGIIEWKAS